MIKPISGTINRVKNFLSNTSGNVAVIFALLSIPVFGIAGAAFDYSRLASERSKVQESVDAALLAGVKEAQQEIINGKSQADAIRIGKETAINYFSVSQIDRRLSSNINFDPVIRFNGSAIEGVGDFSSSIDTSVIAVLGIEEASFSVNSKVNVSAPQFAELHFVLDNSNSMGIGADTDDMRIMQNSSLNCAFACHVPDDSPAWVSSVDDAKNLGVQLRLDVLKDAIKNVLTNVQSKTLGEQVNASVYTFSNELVENQALTDDFNALISSVDNIELAGDWGTGGTSFDHSLEQLESAIGNSGDGLSMSNPRKIVVLITDGVASNVEYTRGGDGDVAPDQNFVVFNPVLNGDGTTAYSIQGFDPKACNRLKQMNNAEIYTINIEYGIPPVIKPDDTRFAEIENRLKPRIVQNLKSCASSSDNFFSANTPDEINDTFNKFLDNVLKQNLALTQ